MHACLTISPPLLPLNKEGGRLFTQTALCRVLSRLTSTIDNRAYYLCLYSALVMAAQTIASILGTSTEHGSGDLQHGLSVGEQPVQRVLLPGNSLDWTTTARDPQQTTQSASGILERSTSLISTLGVTTGSIFSHQ